LAWYKSASSRLLSLCMVFILWLQWEKTVCKKEIFSGFFLDMLLYITNKTPFG